MNQASAHTPGNHFRWLLLILLLAVALRLGMALYLGNDTRNWLGGTADQVSYHNLALRLLDGHGFSFATSWWPATAANEPTAHWSYLYTGFLALVYAIFGHNPLAARLIQAVVTGLLLPWLTFRIGARVWGERVGLLAAAFMAVYFYFVIFSAALMTEAFYTIALLWLVDVGQRWGELLVNSQQSTGGSEKGEVGSGVSLHSPENGTRIFTDERGLRIRENPRLSVSYSKRLQSGGWMTGGGYGVELGAAIGAVLLLRQVGLFVVVGVLLWLLWLGWRGRGLRPMLGGLAVAGGVVCLLLLPWAVRNYYAFGTVSPLPNTNSGFALYWANHTIYGTQFETVLSSDHGVSYQSLIPAELRHLNEAEMDKALRQAGVEMIREDLPRYFWLSLSRIPVQFQFWPTADSSLAANAARLFSFGLTLPFIIIGVALFLPSGVRASAGRRFWQRGAAWTAADWQAAQGWLLLGIIVVYNLLHILTWAKVRYRLPTDAFMFMFAALAVMALWQKVMNEKGRR
jgi:hypothetical protein